ncbi:MAG: hypothetical protein KDD38_00470 [Bdellovibrionales bacterium]|nr:hypothetical protein [Bdellovibrionales bacterium]
MRKFILLTFCILFGLLPHSEAVSAAKMSKKQKAQFSKPFPMLTFEQIARLEYSQRVKYVKQFRRIALEIEKAQFMFKDPLFVNNQLKDAGDKSELYAFIMGDFSYAADDHTRGAQISDRCIYAYNLSKYPSAPSGERKPFGCEIPSGARCNGANGAGVQCGYYLSGLSGAADRACIPNAVRYRATSECDVVRSTLSKENGAAINSSIADAEKYFKFKVPGAKISKADMTSESAAAVLKNLADNAYDDKAYAELIYVLSFYKKNNVQIPLNHLGEQYNAIRPDVFESNVNTLQASVNQVFGDYINHCSRPLSQDEVSKLRDPKWINEAAQKGFSAAVLEKRRVDAVAQLDSVSSSEYRVDNVLQIPECRAIYARRDEIQRKMHEIVGSYPELSDDAPAIEVPTPPAPPKDNYTIQSTGCSSNVVAEVDQLYWSSARCVSCLAERNMAKTANAQTSQEEKDRRQFYSTSKKWLSLLSTMVIACDDGVSNNTHVTPETMIQYMQTYGHCDTDTYEWDPAGLTGEERARIEEWSDNDFWSDKRKTSDRPDIDINKDFVRVYGISYENATKAFCDPDQFKKKWYNSQIRKRNENYVKPTKSVQMAESRKRWRDLLDGKSDTRLKPVIKVSPDNYKKDSVADALFQCMHESRKTADDLYSGNSNTCSKTVSFRDGNYQNGFDKMVDDIKSNGGTALMFNRSDCFVAKQYELDDRPTRGDKRESIGFVDPKAQWNDLDRYAQMAYFKGDKRPVLSGFPQYGRAGEVKDGRNRRPIEIEAEYLNSYSFTVPSGELCTIANGGSSSSGGSRKAK